MGGMIMPTAGSQDIQRSALEIAPQLALSVCSDFLLSILKPNIVSHNRLIICAIALLLSGFIYI
ncbi:MAG: hypothetical protein HY282_15010 [Nitrospirae bacterium]|nr:hypothetical protein [Candidatus Manganitrophaceae bacterium]